MKNLALFTCSLFAASVYLSHDASAAEVTFSTKFIEGEGALFESGTYVSRDVVTSLNSTSSHLTLGAHNALGMDEASSLSRLGFMLTVGQLNTRAHYANSIMFGHEFSHFQHAHRFGFTEHSFTDDETGEEISNLDAYKNLFFGFSVGGPATSRGQHNHEEYETEGSSTFTSGLNWQMSYSEDWIRAASRPGTKTSFDSTDFFINRSYVASYANLDRDTLKKTGTSTGDVYKFVQHLDPDGDADKMLKKITIYGIAANLASPVFWQAAAAPGRYVTTGQTDFEIDYFDTKFGGVTWDVPQYLNNDGFTIAPTFYIKPDAGILNDIGVNDLLLSASYETAVMGEADPELRITATGSRGAFQADVGVSYNGDAAFMELDAGYNVSKSMSLNVGAAITKGDTLRGKRNMPTGDSATWANVRFQF